MSITVVDSPNAWLIVAGGFISNFIVGGFAKTLGVVIAAFQEIIEGNTAYFTLTGGLIYTFMYIFSLVSHLITERVGPARVIFVGGLGAALSVIGGSFATNILQWILSMGVTLGLSLSLIYANIFITVGKGFRKYMGIASGLAVSGVSIGQMIFPFFLNYVLKIYAARGGTLVGAAIMLNFCVTAALMPRYIVVNEEERYALSCKLRKIPNKRVRTPSNILQVEHEEAGDKEAIITLTSVPEGLSHAKRLTIKKIRQQLHHWLLAIFVILKITADIGDVGQSIILPIYAKTDCKFTDSQLNYAIMTAGFVDLISRLVIGKISDMPKVRRSLILFGAYVTEAVVAVLFALSRDSYPMFVICYGLFGAASGTAITLMVVVISDFVTPKNLSKGFAITMAVVGLFIAVGMFLVGLIKDVTGNFFLSFITISILMSFSSLVLLLEWPIRRYFQRLEMAEIVSQEFGSDDEKRILGGDIEDEAVL